MEQNVIFQHSYKKVENYPKILGEIIKPKLLRKKAFSEIDYKCRLINYSKYNIIIDKIKDLNKIFKIFKI